MFDMKNQSGLTLFELLIAVALLGLGGAAWLADRTRNP